MTVSAPRCEVCRKLTPAAVLATCRTCGLETCPECIGDSDYATDTGSAVRCKVCTAPRCSVCGALEPIGCDGCERVVCGECTTYVSGAHGRMLCSACHPVTPEARPKPAKDAPVSGLSRWERTEAFDIAEEERERIERKWGDIP